jgi:kumamolisin
MGVLKTHRIIKGSEKKEHPNAELVGEVDPGQWIEITLLIRSRPSGRHRRRGAKSALRQSHSPENRQHVTHKELTAQRGADPGDLLKIKAFAREHHLTIVKTSIGERNVKVAGTIGHLASAFRLTLKRYKIGNHYFRGRIGGISIPRELSEIIVGVFGLDDRPVTKVRPRVYHDMPNVKQNRLSQANVKRRQGTVGTHKAAVPLGYRTVSQAYPTVSDIARRYNFPEGLDGAGQCIAIIELNDVDEAGRVTGTGFSMKDLKAYFKSVGKSMPKIEVVVVNDGINMPGANKATDGEVMLDIEVAGTVAPGATIAVYFAPNNDRGFIDAVKAALHDRTRKPSVISISWALGDEEEWTRQARNAFSEMLQDAAALGITVCCASGDSGSDIRDEQDRDGRPHLFFPVADPYILSCGGTKIGPGSRDKVWRVRSYAATGGGVSTVYHRPRYQSKSRIPKSPKGTVGRGVPDVAGYAAGYPVKFVGGKWGPDGGTSAVSPLWAGLIALINQRLVSLGKPRAGFINPLLYQMAPSSGAFHDVVQGDNDTGHLGRYKAHRGWDACTGLGTPDGTKLMKALGG